MMKIRHIQTGEVRKIRRWDWEKHDQYTQFTHVWQILDQGDPVRLWQYWSKDIPPSEDSIIDREEAISIIKGDPGRFFYKEIDSDYSNKNIPILATPTTKKQLPVSDSSMKEVPHNKLTDEIKKRILEIVVGIIIAVLGTWVTAKLLG